MSKTIRTKDHPFQMDAKVVVFKYDPVGLVKTDEMKVTKVLSNGTVRCGITIYQVYQNKSPNKPHYEWFLYSRSLYSNCSIFLKTPELDEEIATTLVNYPELEMGDRQKEVANYLSHKVQYLAPEKLARINAIVNE
jgi:hypothetical protein